MPILEECSGEYKITSPIKEDDRVMENEQTKERTTGQFNIDEYQIFEEKLKFGHDSQYESVIDPSGELEGKMKAHNTPVHRRSMIILESEINK